jgi:hypothetical protein
MSIERGIKEETVKKGGREQNGGPPPAPFRGPIRFKFENDENSGVR